MVVEDEPGPSMTRNAEAIGQKMSGGLQAWITANRPDRRALSVSRAVARNEYAYSMMKPSLLPPGA